MKKLITMVASLALAVGCMLPQQLHAEETAEAIVKTKGELQAAINNAGISTITLGADINCDVVIPSGKTLTLNLGGYTLTDNGDHTIKNNGVLTIQGNGKIDNVTHQKAALDNDGTAYLEGGNFIRSKENGKDTVDSGGNSFYAIRNHGRMTINEAVSVTQSGHYSSLIENGWYNGNDNTSGQNSIMEINGGTFTGGLNTIKNDDYGEITINGGTFENVSQSALMNFNIATINGGSFMSNKDAVLNQKIDNVMDKGQITITNGVFVGQRSAIAPTNGTVNTFGDIKISGGTFSSDPTNCFTKNLVVEGYDAFETDNGFVVAPLATSIALSEKDISMEEGASKTLTATLTPEGTLETVAWSSSDEKVATVKDGNIMAVAVGTAIITAKTESGKTASCTVTVIKPVKVETPSVDTTKPADEIKVGVNDEKADQVLETTADQIIAGTKGFTDDKTAQAVIDAVNAGKTVSIVADIKEADTNNAAVKAGAEKIQKKLEALTAESKNMATVAMYLDLNVQIKADNAVLGNITKLNEPITFTVMVPEKLMAEGRNFYIIRVHDDEVKKIVPDQKGNVLTFGTDRFSTYAVIYEDKKVEEGGTTPDPKPETPDVKPTTPDKTVYNVVFVDMNGAVLRTEKVDANGSATAPNAPSVDGYRFVKWDTDFTNVTKDLLVKPIYEKVAAAETPVATEKKPSGDKKSPDTGDTTATGLFTAFALLGLVSMGIIIVQRKRKQLLK